MTRIQTTIPQSGSAGFSYVEVLLAVLLLGLCAAPAAEALRSALGTADVSATELTQLHCLTSHMERTLAVPYRSLVLAAAGVSTPSAAYSLPADTSCGQRDVYLSPYNPDTFPTYPSADTGLLQVVVKHTPAGAPARSLVTVVAR